MTKHVLAIVLGMLGCGIAGCSSSTIVDGTAHSKERPATRPQSQVRRHVFHTSIAPGDAADAIVDVYRTLNFMGRDSNGNGSLPAMRDQGDYFYARTGAETATGETIFAVCKWEGEGRTRVQLESTLPEAKDTFVVGRIRAAISGSATRPVDRPEPGPR